MFFLRETSERTISTQLCKYWEMQGILGAAEGASGTQEDVKEAQKVCLLFLRLIGSILNDSLRSFRSKHKNKQADFHNFHRPFQCVQDSENDHGEELPARHHFQLQQERVWGLRAAGGQTGL